MCLLATNSTRVLRLSTVRSLVLDALRAADESDDDDDESDGIGLSDEDGGSEAEGRSPGSASPRGSMNTEDDRQSIPDGGYGSGCSSVATSADTDDPDPEVRTAATRNE